MSLNSLVPIVWLALYFLLVYTPPASAYIDPTAAGAALQSLYVLGVSLFMSLTLAPRKVATLCKQLWSRVWPLAPEPDEGSR